MDLNAAVNGTQIESLLFVIPEEAGRGQGGMTWGFAERLVLSGAG